MAIGSATEPGVDRDHQDGT